MPKMNWDNQRARQLLEEGMDDLAVAEAVGCSLPALRSWKHRNGLTKLPIPEEGSPKTANVATATDERPTPVGISFCLCGCAVTIEAPSYGSAQRIMEKLHGCLEGTSPF